MVAIPTGFGYTPFHSQQSQRDRIPEAVPEKLGPTKRTFYVSKIGSTGFLGCNGRRSGGVGVGCNRVEGNLMTVAELIAILQTMPQDAPVAVNDNRRGNFYDTVDQVDHFAEDFADGDPEVVVLQVNT